MTIDEAIKHCEEVAQEKDKSVELYKAVKATEGLIVKCETCAEEHRQLAEWLKELKEYKNYYDVPERIERTVYHGRVEYKCSKCGNIVRHKDIHCRQCGHRLVSDEEIEANLFQYL